LYIILGLPIGYFPIRFLLRVP